MQDLCSRLVRREYSMLFMGFLCMTLDVFLSSCSTGLPIQREAQTDGVTLGVQYSIVCVIHGDGDYLYHDTDGNAYNADEEALAGAQRVALQNPRAEVFIFHQKPLRHLVFLFSLEDGDFYYYRNGRLIANESYWRVGKQSDPEVELYHRFRTDPLPEEVNMFLYYGHEVPEFGGEGYDASYPERSFTVCDLAGMLHGFTDDSAKFDLIVLSTCFGGTPYTISALGSFARTVIASPDNLHLSYFDLQQLERLDLSLHERDFPAFAEQFARQAFTRLTRDVQTAVSVVVYDVDRVHDYLLSVKTIYDSTLTALNEKPSTSAVRNEHCDCADIPAFVLPTINKGVKIFYRAARFGRSKNKQKHSGWECWSERGPQAVPAQTAEPVLE